MDEVTTGGVPGLLDTMGAFCKQTNEQGLADLPSDGLDGSNVGPSNTAPAGGESGGASRLRIGDSKEEVLKYLGRVLILPVQDGKYRSPVVTLHNSDTSNLYSLLERHLRSDVLPGAEKFWKIVRLDQHLDTWRPRVHGTQLKALLNCRLPEQADEFVAAEKAIASIKWVLRPETSPEGFVAELRKFVAGVEVWWDHRNSRRPPAETLASNSTLKRAGASLPGAPPVKQQQTSASQQALQLQPLQNNSSMQQLQSGASLRKATGVRSQDNLVNSSPVYGQQGLLRVHNNFSDNGFGNRESSDDLGFGANGAADLGQLLAGNGRSGGFGSGAGAGGGGQPGSHNPHVNHQHGSLPVPAESNSVVSLNVGGHVYTTTVSTLTSVPGSLFWQLLNPSNGMTDAPPRTPAGEIFLDRNGKVFTYILEYLRAAANKEVYSPLPEDANELVALAREAEYFGLTGLLERIRNTPIMPQACTHAVYDSIYLETGFNSIEGPSLKEMEQRKVVVMQQMNHVLAQKALDGFFVAACDCGVNHREGPDGMQHNLFYHILLKKVMPIPHMAGAGVMHHQMAMAMQQQHQMGGMGQQGQQGLSLPIPMPGMPAGGGMGRM